MITERYNNLVMDSDALLDKLKNVDSLEKAFDNVDYQMAQWLEIAEGVLKDLQTSGGSSDDSGDTKVNQLMKIITETNT